MPAELSQTVPLLQSFVGDIGIGKKQFTVELNMGRGDPIAKTLTPACLNLMQNNIQLTYGEEANQTRTDGLIMRYPNDNCIEFIMIVEQIFFY